MNSTTEFKLAVAFADTLRETLEPARKKTDIDLLLADVF
jgi:hypothetical protein